MSVTKVSQILNPQFLTSAKLLKSLVGARGFEPPTP